MLPAFADKGWMSALLQSIAVSVPPDPRLAPIGAAAVAAELRTSR